MIYLNLSISFWYVKVQRCKVEDSRIQEIKGQKFRTGEGVNPEMVEKLRRGHYCQFLEAVCLNPTSAFQEYFLKESKSSCRL